MEKFAKGVGLFVIFLVVLTFLSVIGAYPTKWLVNYLFTPGLLNSVFGTPSISFWQALALNVLFGLLVKSSNTSKK